MNPMTHPVPVFDRHFDRVAVISLPHAQERAGRALRELAERGLSSKAVIVRAVDGKLCPPTDWWPSGAGAWGCMQSHYRVVQDALLDGIESLLVIEDDCIWQKGAATMAEEFLDQVPDDWGQIYFGGQHRDANRPEWVKDKPAVQRARRVHRTHAYAIHRRAMAQFLKHIVYAPDYIDAAKAKVPHKRHIDHQLEVAHQRGDWKVYCPSFWLAGQGENKSDINGKTWPAAWWHLSWRENYRRLPVVICDRAPSSAEMKFLHFGRHIDVTDPTVDAGVRGSSDAADLCGIFEKIASEAYGKQVLPAMHGGWPEKADWLRSKWSVPLLLLSENPDLEALCDYPGSKIVRHDWFNPAVVDASGNPSKIQPSPPMHSSVYSFVQRVATPSRIAGKRVLELGSYNVNGSPRDAIEPHGPAVYHGIDMQAQDRYVNEVADAITATHAMEPGTWDVVVCTEILEHVEQWRELLEGAHRAAGDGGLVIVTTRGPGFPLHGFPDDFWRFTVEDFAKIFADYQTIYLSDDPMAKHPGVLFAGYKCGSLDFEGVKPIAMEATPHTAEWLEIRKRRRSANLQAPDRFAAFYHIACMGNWQEVVAEQMDLFRDAGITPLAVVIGTEEQADWVTSVGAEVIAREDDLKLYETPTLARLWAWSRENPTGAVLYAHTKGVSHHGTPDDGNRIAWRRLMGQQVIRCARRNLQSLALADLLGVDSQLEQGMHYFPGNFWMARADWISHLPDPWEFRRNGGPALFGQPWERMHAEVWAGCRNGYHTHPLLCRGQQLWSDTVFDLLEVSTIAGNDEVFIEDGSSETRAADHPLVVIPPGVLETRCNGSAEQILVNLARADSWRKLVVATTSGGEMDRGRRRATRRARGRAAYDVEASPGLKLGEPSQRLPRRGGGEWLVWAR